MFGLGMTKEWTIVSVMSILNLATKKLHIVSPLVKPRTIQHTLSLQHVFPEPTQHTEGLPIQTDMHFVFDHPLYTHKRRIIHPIHPSPGHPKRKGN